MISLKVNLFKIQLLKSHVTRKNRLSKMRIACSLSDFLLRVSQRTISLFLQPYRPLVGFTNKMKTLLIEYGLLVATILDILHNLRIQSLDKRRIYTFMREKINIRREFAL
jgi:hypothetical protein